MMKTFRNIAAPAALLVSIIVSFTGCYCGRCELPMPPLGTRSDAIWRRQEAGAAASAFVIYQNEFEPDGVRLNLGGEDHLRSIAARLHCGAPVPVVVERSMTSVRPDSEFKYPVNPNPELDMKRRDAVVKTLIAMGIPDADHRVLVAPAMAEGYTAVEAVRAYDQGLTVTATGHESIGAPKPGSLNNIGVVGSYGVAGNIP